MAGRGPVTLISPGRELLPIRPRLECLIIKSFFDTVRVFRIVQPFRFSDILTAIIIERRYPSVALGVARVCARRPEYYYARIWSMATHIMASNKTIFARAIFRRRKTISRCRGATDCRLFIVSVSPLLFATFSSKIIELIILLRFAWDTRVTPPTSYTKTLCDAGCPKRDCSSSSSSRYLNWIRIHNGLI